MKSQDCAAEEKALKEAKAALTDPSDTRSQREKLDAVSKATTNLANCRIRASRPYILATVHYVRSRDRHVYVREQGGQKREGWAAPVSDPFVFAILAAADVGEKEIWVHLSEWLIEHPVLKTGWWGPVLNASVVRDDGIR